MTFSIKPPLYVIHYLLSANFIIHYCYLISHFCSSAANFYNIEVLPKLIKLFLYDIGRFAGHFLTSSDGFENNEFSWSLIIKYYIYKAYTYIID